MIEIREVLYLIYKSLFKTITNYQYFYRHKPYGI